MEILKLHIFWDGSISSHLPICVSQKIASKEAMPILARQCRMRISRSPVKADIFSRYLHLHVKPTVGVLFNLKVKSIQYFPYCLLYIK